MNASSFPLNAAQREAVSVDRGPVLVLAGAGSGKTRVVTLRIARLIRSGVPADRILAVTFTNKAAQEMQERVAELLPQRAKRRPTICTFHSYCVSLLRRQIGRLGYPTRFSIYAAGPQRALAQRVLREVRVAGSALRPDDLLQYIGRWKSKGICPERAGELASHDREHLAALAYGKYQSILRSQAAVDFDDLLWLSEQILDRFPDARRAEAERLEHLLIDEYQDTNPSQYRIARALAEGHRNLYVVGDDDQSIYSWRGADVTHILNFRKDWPEARVIRMEENYRSTSAILEMANRLIAVNVTRHAKRLRAQTISDVKPRVLIFDDEEQEAAGIAQDVREKLESRKWTAREIAILFRTNEQPRAFEQELRRQGVPYLLLGGRSFFDRKEIQDLLAYLRLLIDPHDDVSWLRACNRPVRGIGRAAMEGLRKRAVAEGCSIWSLLQRNSCPVNLSSTARAGVDSFTALILEFQQLLTKRALPAVVRELVSRVNYQQEIEASYEDSQERDRRWQGVQELLSDLATEVRRRPKTTLHDYLNDLCLRGNDFESPQTDPQQGQNLVRLMTLHAAKGLEFPVVYMVGLEEGILPHKHSAGASLGAIEEERRLCYVGVTRARQVLTLSLARQRTYRGRRRGTHPSRFLYELLGKTSHPDYQASITFASDNFGPRPATQGALSSKQSRRRQPNDRGKKVATGRNSPRRSSKISGGSSRE